MQSLILTSIATYLLDKAGDVIIGMALEYTVRVLLKRLNGSVAAESRLQLLVLSCYLSGLLQRSPDSERLPNQECEETEQKGQKDIKAALFQ